MIGDQRNRYIFVNGLFLLSQLSHSSFSELAAEARKNMDAWTVIYERDTFISIHFNLWLLEYRCLQSSTTALARDSFSCTIVEWLNHVEFVSYWKRYRLAALFIIPSNSPVFNRFDIVAISKFSFDVNNIVFVRHIDFVQYCLFLVRGNRCAYFCKADRILNKYRNRLMMSK